MKTLFLVALVCICACTSVAKAPGICRRNLRDCLAAYEDDKVSFCNERSGLSCSQEDWNKLCLQDMNVCRGN
jgi:hypothetical protein